MAFAPIANDFYKIIEQLLTVFYFPIVIALIYGDNKSLVGSLHIGNEFHFITFHITHSFL